MKNNCNIGQAIDALKRGEKVAREGWNGKDMFVFMQVPSIIKEDIVPKMQSLPQSVKDHFIKTFSDEEQQIDAIYYDNQLALVNKSNLINGWAPSVSDALATDWVLLDVNETWLERLVIEQVELQDKCNKLRNALQMELVPDSQVNVLSNQLELMDAYNSHLVSRLIAANVKMTDSV